MIEPKQQTFIITPRCQQDLRNFTLYHKQLSDRIIVDAKSQGEKVAIIHSRAVLRQIKELHKSNTFQHLPETT